MSKLTVRLVNVIKLFSFHHDNLRTLGDRVIKLQFLTLFKAITNFGLPPNGEDKVTKYWTGKSVDEIIAEADLLFDQGKYLQVYELLNRLKFCNNIEVQWRIGRALFKLSHEHEITEDIRREMIDEAYEIIQSSLTVAENSPIIHKWAAIIIDRKNGMKGLEHRVKNSEVVKHHLIRTCELDPDDVTAQYLLGRWCYEMSNITWFQRIIAKLLYGEAPRSSFEEANKYLSRAEDLHPRFYLQNTYLLGKTCLKLGQYYRAKHYFGVVGNLPVHNEYERHCANDAKKLLKRLDKYSLEKNALFYEYPFGTNE
ncbi:regulator of microtubule dynamics protein 1 [Tribolium castaneum]|uniref:Regulator of microtubule dynamics protein 1 n=1 Tax=Tribolium castaneum TaxID=7070 RepID=D6WVU0_TRICA|nr:PREDICTED: regulator of microtubule dynamics protein 1 [Tribolium castaneum]EFA08242.1 Regulator of microtubule dynamics protein 1-like Protein [Tribolium castaneum]|eukprot:XP_969858.1 PREDICTED: regulator of microtubule dynamics protein 1 [Tribolium castaneum]